MAAGVLATTAAAAAIAKRRADQKIAQNESVEVFHLFAAPWKLAVEIREAAGAPAPRMSGVVADVDCAFEIALDGQGWAHTRVLAEAHVPVDAVISVHPGPHAMFSAIKRALFGSDSVVVGDGPFDEHFLVHATPHEAAVALLDAPLRDALKVWLAHGLEAFSYERGRITLMWRDVERDFQVLDAAFALVARAAAWRPEAKAETYRG